MSQPLLSKKNSWAKFEKTVLEVFILALQILNKEQSLPIVEDSVKDDCLNRRLSFCVARAILEWERINDEEILTPPIYDSKNQPDLKDEQAPQPREQKRPDFQWSFRDKLGTSLDKTFKFYIIECKRLGKKLGLGRKLNEEYIVKGALRFVEYEHSYGQSSSSGAMIGYVQDMELQALLDEVNSAATTASLPALSLSLDGWKEDVTRLDHRLDRIHVQPTPFDLRHLWVDLRHHYEGKLEQDVEELVASVDESTANEEKQTASKVKQANKKPKLSKKPKSSKTTPSK